MSGNVMMTAIGNLHDRYILEFAEVTPLKKRPSAFVTKILPLAACLSVVIMLVIFFVQNKGVQQGYPPSSALNGSIIWGSGAADNIVEDYSGQAAKGTIIITNSLKTAIANSTNDRDLFAVLVTEMSNASRDDVYNIFVKPLNIEEQYIATGVILISENQIRSLVCPPNFALVLSLAVKAYEDRPINPDTLDAVEGERITVKVYLKWNVDDLLAQHQEQLEHLHDEEYQKTKQSIIKLEVSKIVGEFIADYEIANESIDTMGIYIPEFTAELDTALIAQIMEDDRVDIVLENTDSIGLDQIQQAA